MDWYALDEANKKDGHYRRKPLEISSLEDCLTLWDMSNNLNYEIIREKIQETLKDLGDIYPELTQRLTDLLAAMPEREAE